MFCDFAGAKVPAELTGRSIRPWTERSAMVPANDERRFVVTEVNYTNLLPRREGGAWAPGAHRWLHLYHLFRRGKSLS